MPTTFATSPSTSTRLLRAVRLLAIALLISAFALFALPGQAQALTTEKCTARPNTDSGSTILGGKATRITWEAQATIDDLLTSLTIEFPEGTTIDDETLLAQSTVNLVGEKLTQLEATFTITGNTVTATFPWQRGESLLRMTVYGITFAAEGGEMPLTLRYTTYYGGSEVYTVDEQPIILVEAASTTQRISDWLAEQRWVKAWNSVTFLNLFLNPVLVVRSLPVVLQGFLRALGIVLCAFPAAIPFGMLLALMRISRRRFLRGLASLYVNVVRGTPLFLQIYVAFFGLPLAGVKIPSFLLGVIVLALNSAAYMCEIFRAGIQSIPKGQFEASRSLGMTHGQTMFYVIIPQMVRRVIPTLTSEFILLYKDTSLLAAVGVMEIIMYARTIVATTGSITPYIVAALFYLLITLPLAKLVGLAERRLSGSDGGSGTPAAKKAKRTGAAAKGILADAAREADEALAVKQAEVAAYGTGRGEHEEPGPIGAIAGTEHGSGYTRGISPEQMSSL
ncbi:MAG: amino acid ABC transporter permease [Eggerthellaceae bacterium]|nr:amino acid ABC transporter permease [Eggerthellaceae bacterium]